MPPTNVRRRQPNVPLPQTVYVEKLRFLKVPSSQMSATTFGLLFVLILGTDILLSTLCEECLSRIQRKIVFFHSMCLVLCTLALRAFLERLYTKI